MSNILESIAIAGTDWKYILEDGENGEYDDPVFWRCMDDNPSLVFSYDRKKVFVYTNDSPLGWKCKLNPYWTFDGLNSLVSDVKYMKQILAVINAIESNMGAQVIQEELYRLEEFTNPAIYDEDAYNFYDIIEADDERLYDIYREYVGTGEWFKGDECELAHTICDDLECGMYNDDINSNGRIYFCLDERKLTEILRDVIGLPSE